VEAEGGGTLNWTWYMVEECEFHLTASLYLMEHAFCCGDFSRDEFKDMVRDLRTEYNRLAKDVEDFCAEVRAAGSRGEE